MKKVAAQSVLVGRFSPCSYERIVLRNLHMAGNVPSTINFFITIYHIHTVSNISFAFSLYPVSQTYLGGVLQFRQFS